MNPIIQTQFGMADPNASPLTINELITLLNTLVTSQMVPENQYKFYIISHDAPGVEDRDKVWIETDTQGKPKAIKIWTTHPISAWRRVYNGMLGEIRGFTGNPTTYFGGGGKGLVGLDYDGWAICNGDNGTPDLSDKFLIGAHMHTTPGHEGYHNGWQTFVDGEADLKTGGLNKFMLQQKHLPGLDNGGSADPDSGLPQEPGLYTHGKAWKDGATHASNPIVIVDIEYGMAKPHSYRIAKYGADLPGRPSNPPNPQKEVPTLPPFYALAWITFIGYV